MTPEHLARKANNIPDAQPAGGQYDEDAIRRGALELIAEQQRRDSMLESARAEVADEMAALKSVAQAQAKSIDDLFESNKAQANEIARLLGCVRELEREGLEKPHQGFTSWDAFADAREWSESPHSDGQDGQMDNTTGAWAHLV